MTSQAEATRAGKSPAVIVAIAILAVLGLFYWATFRWLVNSWLANDYYSHGFLVPLISAFFIWTKRKQLVFVRPSALGITVLAIGAFLHVLGSILVMPFLDAISLLVVIWAIALCFLGIRGSWTIAFPLAFLIFMVPPPFIQELGNHLQKISVTYSSDLLSAVGLPITTSGPQIYLNEQTFTVGLACSGTNTLIALLALSAVYVYLLTGPFYKKAGLFVLAFPIAIAANVLRIASIIAVAYYYDVKTATTWYHDISSPIFFFIGFLFLILIARILRCRLNVNP